MAFLEQRSGQYRVIFRLAGRRFTRSLKTRNEKEALACVARLEDNVRRFELGLLSLPDDADITDFLISDGRSASKTAIPAIRTLREACDAYLEALSVGAVEKSTLKCVSVHIGHLCRLLGRLTSLRTLGVIQLQGYIAARAKEPGRRGRCVTAATIKKELSTLNAVWSWARESGAIERPLPKRALKLPKSTEKPPFQTWQEIDRIVARGHLSKAAEADLWDCLFLTRAEIEELLEYVRGAARHPFVFPMFVFAAHTGARRSEMLRSELEDINLADGTILIRERKRVRGQLTTRRVPVSPLLGRVLGEWLEKHPGGRSTFCHELHVPHSTTTRLDFGPITRSEATDHFKRTLAGSKWEKLRGWHVFRHSFCSNCAAAGVDQRVINAWVGHQTEEMVRRYRHLIPSQEKLAIETVFGNGQAGVEDREKPFMAQIAP